MSRDHAVLMNALFTWEILMRASDVGHLCALEFRIQRDSIVRDPEKKRNCKSLMGLTRVPWLAYHVPTIFDMRSNPGFYVTNT